MITNLNLVYMYLDVSKEEVSFALIGELDSHHNLVYFILKTLA